jgi:hydrogenase nickel incorporation protein HypA/HybF
MRETSTRYDLIWEHGIACQKINPVYNEPKKFMHEQSIVESILTLALENAAKANARKIISINLVVGNYTGILEEAVNFYFGFLSKDTIAAGARINYTHVPGQLRCRDCDILFPLQKRDYHCPKCAGKRVEVVGGRELYIEDMEVD